MVGLHDSYISAALLLPSTATGIGTSVVSSPVPVQVPVGSSTEGRVMSCLGEPLDGGDDPIHNVLRMRDR